MVGIARSIVLLLIALIAMPAFAHLATIFSGESYYELAADIGTMFLYLSVANLGWTIGSPQLFSSVLGSTLAVMILALGVPAGLSALAISLADEAGADDTTAVLKFEAPKIVALLKPVDTGRSVDWRTELHCALLCQRLLYGGNRDAVLVGASPVTGHPAAATKLRRFSAEYRERCPATDVPEAGTLEGEHSVFGTYPTSDAVQQRIAQGRCLISADGDISEADMAGVWTRSESREFARSRRSVNVVASHRVEVFVKENGSWQSLARSTERHFARVATPLRLVSAGFGFRAKSIDERQAADDPYIVEHILRPWTPKP